MDKKKERLHIIEHLYYNKSRFLLFSLDVCVEVFLKVNLKKNIFVLTKNTVANYSKKS